MVLALKSDRDSRILGAWQSVDKRGEEQGHFALGGVGLEGSHGLVLLRHGDGGDPPLEDASLLP